MPTCSRSSSKAEQKQQHDSDQAGTFAPSLPTGRLPKISLTPAVTLMKEVGRELTIDPETEAKLLAIAKQPMKDVLVVIQDTGMRPEEVFRIRIEHINWSQRLIFNPNGKTKAARRHVPISERMLVSCPINK